MRVCVPGSETEAINHLPAAEGKGSSWDVNLPGSRAGQSLPAFASPMLASVNKKPTSESLVLLKATLASAWSSHGRMMPTARQCQGMGQTGGSHPYTSWRTGACEGEQQAVNKLRQQLTRSGGFFWRRPKDIALNIRHAAHT